MNRKERIMAALKGQEVDRVPVSAWMHFSEVDQDPISLARTQVEFNEKYDFDFIKMMPFGTYSVQDWGAEITFYAHKYHEPIVKTAGIQSVEDYDTLEVLPATYGTWGKQVQLAQRMSKLVKEDTPYIQTIFTPMSTLNKLSKGRVVEDIKTHPEKVKRALEVITETTINFVKANIEAGVSGFFLASQSANKGFIDLESHKEFCTPYDLKVIESYCDKTWFNVMHVHGSDIYFEEMEKYPVNCLNWHDRHTWPSLEEARKITDKCFLGGIQEVPFFVDGVLNYDSIMARSSKDEIIKHVREAIDQVDGKGLIIGPGCVVDPKTSEENLHAIREAVERR